MDVPSTNPNGAVAAAQHRDATPAGPRFGGVLWRLSRLTRPLTLPLAGKRWNPIFAVVEHRGRRTGRQYATPVAARRVAGGFTIPLAFAAPGDWDPDPPPAGGGPPPLGAHADRGKAPQPIAA